MLYHVGPGHQEASHHTGSAFEAIGPAAEKARRPNVRRR